MIADITKAIQDKKQVSFYYKNEGKARRIVNPHCLYETANGKIMFDGYQTKGFTNSTNPNWKQFSLDDITELRIRLDTFEINQGFNSLSNRYLKSITMVNNLNKAKS